MKIDYVGNPLLDAVDAFKPNTDFLANNNLGDKQIVALLPGSRKQEISRLLPEMLGAMHQFPHHQFVVAGAPSFNADYYTQYLGDKNIPVIFNATYDILANAQAAVVASGTATLETALFNVPQVVVYKGNAITIGIARMLIKIKFISLVNLIIDKAVVKELIQQDCTAEGIKEELNNLLHNTHHRQQMLADYDLLDERMGKPGASVKTAKLIVTYTKNNNALLK
jgi:lipid-A-disaccharide synthase